MSGRLPLTTQFMRIKPADTVTKEAEGTELKRSMGLLALTFFSVGSIVGTGIFVILGEAVPKAGPAVLLSFVLAAITCAFSAFSYAELAGSIPVSGSSYSYAYATLGELIAWVCGWCLMLEYGVSVAAVAVGWGQYLNEFLGLFGIQIPEAIANPPGQGGVFNVPAIIVVLACMFLLLRGASESATVNTIMVFTKIGILLFFCAVAFTTFEPGNFEPFIPLGFAGVSAAAGQVFFSYIGFDAASTAGEEAKNAKKDLPRAIIFSLIIVTALYVLVTAAAIGARPWEDFEGSGSEAVLSQIVQQVTGSTWAPAIISIGAIISIFSVVLVVMYGQTRILFAMGRDGLLPKVFTKVNRRTGTPFANTIIVGVLISLVAAVVPLGQLAEATSIGTLFAFGIVNLGVIALWASRPELERTFRSPLMPLFPILGVIFCAYLIVSLAAATWIVFFLWMLVGLAIYFFYGRKRSTAPSARPAPIADDIAAPQLRTRTVTISGTLGIIMLLGLAVAAFVMAITTDGLSTFQRGMWVFTALVSCVGCYFVGSAIGNDKKANQSLAAGDLVTAAGQLRRSVIVAAIAMVIPGLLFVFGTRFGQADDAISAAGTVPASSVVSQAAGDGEPGRQVA